MGKVYQQDQLDKDEHERTNQTKVHHYCELSKNIEKMVSILCIFQHKIMNATIDKDMYIMLIITEYTTICMSVLLD